MSDHAAITVHRAREEVERLWRESQHSLAGHATVSFADAPGDRGTEIHVELSPSGLSATVSKLIGGGPALAKVKDELRRFKQRVETGDIPRSDGTPEGERFERKLKQRPAQPLEQHELDEVGVR